MKYIKFKATSVMTIIVIVAVIGLLTAVILPPLNTARSKQSLNGAVDDVVSILVTARSQTLASYNSHNYGVHIASGSVTMYTGPTYSSGAIGNVVKSFDTGITASSISLAGGGVNVLFDRLKGSTSQYGTIVVHTAGAGSYSKTITVGSTGLVSVQ